jgi:hypothetical protein
MHDFCIHLHDIIHRWLSTLTIPFSEVLEISEGDTELLYAMKLVPWEDLGFRSGVQSVKVLQTLDANSLQFRSVEIYVSRVSSVDCKEEEEEETSSRSPNQISNLQTF